VISFEPFHPGDTARLCEWVATPDELLRWTGAGLAFPLDRAQMEAVLQRATLTGGGVWRVCERGRAVGHIELHPDLGHPTATVARVLVAPAERGRGLATAMLRRIVEIGFDERRLHRLELRVLDGNDAAVACYTRVGFVVEGRLRETRLTADGHRRDTLVMGMLATDPRR
jgi:RimJ/RimL family protein N-acetyltransferase